MQKGTVLSGRILGNIISKEKNVSEKRILHDYAFNLFETKINELDKVTDFNVMDITDDVSRPFAKIRGKAVFNDYKVLHNSVEKHNTLGRALGYITYSNEEEIKKLKATVNGIADRNTKAKGRHLSTLLSKKLDDIYKSDGLIMDDEYLEKLAYIIEYGYKGQFEVSIRHSDNIFTTILDRDCLLEEESLLISKYSRKTEVEFTILGLLSQSGETPSSALLGELEKEPAFKVHSQKMIDIIAGLEETFNGRFGNQFIIDPIAVYWEI